jgi:kumamolisin
MRQFSPSFSRYITLFALSLALQVGATETESAKQSFVRLSGHMPTQAMSSATMVERLEGEKNIPLTFVLPLRNKAVLEELIRQIHDPSNEEHYGQYITPEEFVERFAPTQEDYDQVMGHAKNLGLTVTKTHANRTLLNVEGSAKSIENGFELSLHHYQKPDGRSFYAPDQEPKLPHSIASVIHCVVGLDNHAKWRTYNQRKQIVAKDDPSGYPSGPGGGYAPQDLLVAYNLTNVAEKGSGQIVALLELGEYLDSDIAEYASYFNLPAPQLKNVAVNGGSQDGIDVEVTLDIELALALAPESQIYVYEGPNTDQGILNTYNQIASDNLAKQISTSWGLGEALVNQQQLQAENAIFMQMAAQGQTVYAAAGDSGAYDAYKETHMRKLMVDDPASQPYVIGVGGTRLIVDAMSGAYVSETVWNDGLAQGAGGGGVSTIWPLPSWQTKVPTVYSKTNRNVPDVALNADPETGYAVFYNGEWTTVGGTSCAAPIWAAFNACVNQARVAQSKAVLGFANPLFYTIGLGTSYNTDFHDIKMGNNLHYPSKQGYDNASGWGSFNGANLFSDLTTAQ